MIFKKKPGSTIWFVVFFLLPPIYKRTTNKRNGRRAGHEGGIKWVMRKGEGLEAEGSRDNILIYLKEDLVFLKQDSNAYVNLNVTQTNYLL